MIVFVEIKIYFKHTLIKPTMLIFLLNLCVVYNFGVIYLHLFSFLNTKTSSEVYFYGLTVIPAWISNHMPCNVWDEITYPFLNFNRCTVEV